MTMKRYIRQILLGTLLLGSACTNHQEVIEEDTSVSVVFKTRQLPSTKGENDDEISVLIFRKEKDQFTKVERESMAFRTRTIAEEYLIANRDLSISVGKRILKLPGKLWENIICDRQ